MNNNSNKIDWKFFIKYLPAFFALIGVLIFLLSPAVLYSIHNVDNTYVIGLKAIFGYSEKLAGNTIRYLGLSGGLMLAMLLVLAGGTLSTLKTNIFRFVGAVLCIVGGVFFFLAITFVSSVGQGTAISEYLVLGIGSILGGAFSVLAGCISIFNGFALKE